jgi:acetyl esterase
VEVEDLAVPAGEGARVGLRIVRPVAVQGALPVVLYLHGDSWLAGAGRTDDRPARDLAAGLGAAVVLPSEGGPPRGYPAALERAYAILAWIGSDGRHRGLDGTRVALVGDATGANLCAALTLVAKRRGGPALAAQVLLHPVTDARCETDSYRQFAEGHLLRGDQMRELWDRYTAEPDERALATVSPLRAPVDQLVGLPRALVVTAEAEVLRDEGEAYARRLGEAEVPVLATRYLGTIHRFASLDALRHTTAARAATAQVIDFLTDADIHTTAPANLGGG